MAESKQDKLIEKKRIYKLVQVPFPEIQPGSVYVTPDFLQGYFLISKEQPEEGSVIMTCYKDLRDALGKSTMVGLAL